EVRKEAVEQALQQVARRALPMPSKRASVLNTQQAHQQRGSSRDRHHSDSSSDEDSVLNESSSASERKSPPGRPVPMRPLSADSSTSSATSNEVPPLPPRNSAIAQKEPTRGGKTAILYQPPRHVTQ